MHLPRPFVSIALGLLAAVLGAAEPAPAATGPVVMLKLDDVTRVTPRWQRTADFLEAEGVPANFGVIGDGLERDDPALAAWIKERHAKGTVQFWHHGYASKYPDRDEAKGKKGEFEGTGYDVQLKAFTRTQELAQAKLGFQFTAFGPHWSGTDADTYRALAQRPEIKAVWFYAPKPPATTAAIVIERRMELEKPLFVPNPTAVMEAFEKKGRKLDYIALQGHADQWDDARFAAFKEAVRYLKAQGCRFMTLDAFLASRAK